MIISSFLSMEDPVFATDAILTRKEQVEFQKTGFYMKELFWAKELTQIFFDFLWPLLLAIAIGVWCVLIFNISQIILIITLFSIIPLVFFLRNVYFYIFIGKLFCTYSWIYAINTKKTFSTKTKYLIKALKTQNKSYHWASGFDDLFTKIIVFIFIAVFIWLLEYLLNLWSWFLVWVFFTIITIVTCIYWIIYGLRQCMEHFHPIYIFWNIGKRTKKLITEIEDMSIQIQIENRENINFNIFEKWYNLSLKNYTEILNCIKKMEWIQLQMLYGDGIKIERYFNSLRIDTVNTLMEIKKFMEMKKLQLTDIQNGMIRSASTESEEWKKETESGIKTITDYIEQFDILIKGIL